ncbi:MAG: rod shape-determining protein, partial [Nitrospinota bacterium]
AGDEMDESIQRHLRTRFKLAVGPYEAERIKMAIGSAWPLPKRLYAECKGLNLLRGVPTTVRLSDETVREALEGPVAAIVQSIRHALSRSSPELAEDITRRGIVLAGGGSLLKGLGTRLHHETGLPIYRAKDPLTAIVRGTGLVLENYKELKRVCVS